VAVATVSVGRETTAIAIRGRSTDPPIANHRAGDLLSTGATGTGLDLVCLVGEQWNRHRSRRPYLDLRKTAVGVLPLADRPRLLPHRTPSSVTIPVSVLAHSGAAEFAAGWNYTVPLSLSPARPPSSTAEMSECDLTIVKLHTPQSPLISICCHHPAPSLFSSKCTHQAVCHRLAAITCRLRIERGP